LPTVNAVGNFFACDNENFLQVFSNVIIKACPRACFAHEFPNAAQSFCILSNASAQKEKEATCATSYPVIESICYLKK